MAKKKHHKALLNISRSLSAPLSTFGIALLGIKMFGGQNWGEVIEIQLFVVLVVFVSNWGNKDYLLRAYSKSPKDINVLFFSSLFTRFALPSLSLFYFLAFSIEVSLLAIAITVLQYIYGSFESLTLYFQKFTSFLLAEIIGFSFLLVFILNASYFNIFDVLLAFCLYYLLKIVLVGYSHHQVLLKIKIGWDLKLLMLSLPFFLIGISGWLQSRVDLYLVDFYLSKETLSSYRIVSSAFILIQSTSALVVYPFVKQLFRLKNHSIQKGKTQMVWLSLPVVFVGTLACFIISEHFLFLNLSIWVYVFGMMAAFPSFLFIVDVFNYYKLGEEKKVMYINLIGAVINLSLTYLLIKEYGIIGAMFGTCVSQWVALILFKYYINNENKVS